MPHSTTDPRHAALADVLLALDDGALAALDRLLAVLADPSYVEPVVRARRVEVIDGAGRPRLVLGDLHAGSRSECSPGLALRSADGSERAVLVLDAEGPGLHFALDGDDALSLGVDDPGTEAVQPGPYLELFTPDGTVAHGWRLAGHAHRPDGGRPVSLCRQRETTPSREEVVGPGGEPLAGYAYMTRPRAADNRQEAPEGRFSGASSRRRPRTIWHC